MKTKLFFLLLAIVACSIPSWGEIDVDGIYYDVDWENHTAAVTWPGLFAPMEPHHDYYNGDVIIPKAFVYEDEIFLVTAVGGFTFCEGLVSVSIPSSVTKIGPEAFSGCTNLKSVSFPRNSIKEIGASAFYGCSSLTSIDIPESVISIGSSAFSSCSSLMYLSLGSNLKSIERDVFRNCSSLISVTIPNSVTSIGVGAFYECSSLTSVTIGSGVTRISDYAFGGCSSLTSIVIPNSVTTIEDGAFYSCSSLKSVTIGEGVTTLSNSAFENCTSLTSVVWNAKHCNDFISSPFSYDGQSTINKITFGNIVEHIPERLCSDFSMTSITIPDNVKSIGDFAFQGCTELTSVYIGNGLTTIGEYIFADCTGLTSIDIPDNITTIGFGAFILCTGLTSVSIGNSVTTIEQGAFYGCSSLTSVVIPNSVTTIGPSAFCGCESLADVTLGNSLTYIGDVAFTGCALTSITCKAVIPPVCGDEYDALLFVDRSIPLYVPAGSVDAYKAADTWKEFYNIHPISSTPTAIEDANVSAVRTRKVLNNGMMYILMPDGRTYDMQGKEVK